MTVGDGDKPTGSESELAFYQRGFTAGYQRRVREEIESWRAVIEGGQIMAFGELMKTLPFADRERTRLDTVKMAHDAGIHGHSARGCPWCDGVGGVGSTGMTAVSMPGGGNSYLPPGKPHSGHYGVDPSETHDAAFYAALSKTQNPDYVVPVDPSSKVEYATGYDSNRVREHVGQAGSEASPGAAGAQPVSAVGSPGESQRGAGAGDDHDLRGRDRSHEADLRVGGQVPGVHAAGAGKQAAEALNAMTTPAESPSAKWATEGTEYPYRGGAQNPAYGVARDGTGSLCDKADSCVSDPACPFFDDSVACRQGAPLVDGTGITGTMIDTVRGPSCPVDGAGDPYSGAIYPGGA